MIDRIRQDIQERLDQLLSEAEKLRQALSALGSDRGRAPAQPQRSRQSSRGGGRQQRSSSSQRSRGNGAATGRGRAAAGGTKNSVLKALEDAGGKSMTASEVASATGLGRASVSTTLSKLAKAGDVTKAQRGYQLSGSTDGAGNSR